MEGDINTAKRNGGQATFEDDVALSLLLLKGPIKAAVHDVLEHFFNLCETEFLSQLEVVMIRVNDNMGATHTLVISTFSTLR